jgi:molybdenum cofactor biosynthesis enzyme MoaA
VLTAPFIPELKALGIRSVNLSLDTLDRARFKTITRRDDFDRVRETLDLLLANGMKVKINAVVMEGKNTDDIVPLANLTRDYPIDVRFIEEMPFNGEGAHYTSLYWTYHRIIDHLRQHFPGLEKIPDADHATAYGYHIPGFAGSLGVIAAFSRTFCGSCNRIRITAQGMLKTCLYDDGVLDLKTLLRRGASDADIGEQLQQAFRHRPKDGREAEQHRKHSSTAHESMSTIGG